MNKKILFAILLGVTVQSTWAADWVDTATVVSSTPIIERIIEPQQDCWIEQVRVREEPREPDSSVSNSGDPSVGGAIVGGIVGGVLGNQVGKGRGRTAATVVGAIAGSVLGSKAAGSTERANNREEIDDTPRVREEQRCRQIERAREVIKAYDVIYLYRGQEIHTQLPYRPGKNVKVGISIIQDQGSSFSTDQELNEPDDRYQQEERHERRKHRD